MVLSCRQELAVVLVLSAGEPLGREEGRNGPAVETDRGLVTALAEIECGLIEREFVTLERWLAYMSGAPVKEEFERARLCEDFEKLGWHVQPPEGGP